MARRKSTRKPVTGDVIQVRFHDHCEDGDEAIEFLVWGRLNKITRWSYHLHAWAFADAIEEAKNENHENEKTFTIVKKAVLEIKILEPVDG